MRRWIKINCVKDAYENIKIRDSFVPYCEYYDRRIVIEYGLLCDNCKYNEDVDVDKDLVLKPEEEKIK